VVNRLENKDRPIISRVVTLVESLNITHRHKADEIFKLLFQRYKKKNDGRALDKKLPTFRIGICGAPGSGKSSLIEKIGMNLIRQGMKVAVLAIDPSSARSGGSILGDKTRMDELSKEANAFVRPSPTKGYLGGVSLNTNEIVTLCEHVGFDAVLIETVGVGQSEIEIDTVSDFVVYVVPPASGDELQASKKGVMEIADLVVVNKYDSEYVRSCRIVKHQILSGLHFSRQKVDGWTVPVELVSAHSEINIESIWKNAMKFKDEQKDYIVKKRAEQLLHGLWAYMGDMLIKKLKEDSTHKYADLIAKTEKKLVNQEITPNYAATEILRDIFGE
jgi:LAO/AO transport system kinase